MQRTCERCGTFLSEESDLRHCAPCATRLREEAEAANRHGPLAILSTASFMLGVFGLSLTVPLLLVAFPSGVILGFASLARRRGNQSLAIAGLVLNGLVLLAFVIIGTLAGWAA